MTEFGTCRRCGKQAVLDDAGNPMCYHRPDPAAATKPAIARSGRPLAPHPANGGQLTWRPAAGAVVAVLVVLVTGLFWLQNARDSRSDDQQVASWCASSATWLRVHAGEADTPARRESAEAALNGTAGLYPSVDDQVDAACGDTVAAMRTAAGHLGFATLLPEERASSTPSEGADTSVRDALRAAGVNDGDIDLLAVVADDTDYLGASTQESKESFALMAVLECRDVASGERTWAISEAEAISTGASVSDARRMTTYLSQVFCLGVG